MLISMLAMGFKCHLRTLASSYSHKDVNEIRTSNRPSCCRKPTVLKTLFKSGTQIIFQHHHLKKKCLYLYVFGKLGKCPTKYQKNLVNDIRSPFTAFLPKIICSNVQSRARSKDSATLNYCSQNCISTTT